MRNPRAYMFLNYLSRYIITGIVLYISAKSPKMEIFTCFIGLINVKIALYANNFYQMLETCK